MMRRTLALILAAAVLLALAIHLALPIAAQDSGSLSSLFSTGDNKNEERARTNQQFCDGVVFLGGKDCLASKICARRIKANPGEGAAVGREAIGSTGFLAPVPIAHIQAERAPPAVYINDEGRTVKEWTYRFTYYLRNAMPDREISYNIVLSGPNTTREWWPEQQELLPKEIAGMAGSAAQPFTSEADYNRICMVFNPKLYGYDGRRIREVCNAVTEYPGAATAPPLANPAPS